MRQRIDLGAGLVALGAIGLLISLFLDWYSPATSAWEAFELVDWALVFCALAALVAVASAFRDGTTPPSWLTGVTIAALVLVASQLIDPPPAARGAGREAGAWIALASALVMNLSILLSAASVSVTVDVRGRERRRRVAAADRRERESYAAPAPPPPPAPPPAGRDPERTEPLRPVEPRDDPEMPA